MIVQPGSTEHYQCSISIPLNKLSSCQVDLEERFRACDWSPHIISLPPVVELTSLLNTLFLPSAVSSTTSTWSTSGMYGPWVWFFITHFKMAVVSFSIFCTVTVCTTWYAEWKQASKKIGVFTTYGQATTPICLNFAAENFSIKITNSQITNLQHNHHRWPLREVVLIGKELLSNPCFIGYTWFTYTHEEAETSQVGRVCWSDHHNTPQFTATKFAWSLELSWVKKRVCEVEEQSQGFSWPVPIFLKASFLGYI